MPTANEALDPARVRQDIQHLQRMLAEAVARETDLARERGSRVVTVRREQTRAEESDEALQAARLTELKEAHQRDLEHLRARGEARRAWIQRAYHAARSSLAERVQRDKDTRIGRVQSRILRRKQEQQKELAAAKQAHRALQELLVADREERHQLRTHSLQVLRAFRLWFHPWFSGKGPGAPPEIAAGTPEALREASREDLAEARTALDAAKRLPLAKLFRWLPFLALLGAIVVTAVFFALRAGGGAAWAKVWPPAAAAATVLVALDLVALVTARPVARRIATALAAARARAVAAEQASAALIAAKLEEIRREEEEQGRGLSETFRDSDAEWHVRMSEGQRDLEARHAALPAKLDALYQRSLAKLQQKHETALDTARLEAETRAAERESAQEARITAEDQRLSTAIEAIAGPWREELAPLYQKLASLDAAAQALFPPWTPESCRTWAPPVAAPQGVRIGKVGIDLEALAGGLPHDPRLALPGPARFEVPLALRFPARGSLLLESEGETGAAEILHAAVLRVLAVHPPGRVAFTLIDPVGLGRDFAGLMHLADYEESLIHHRIWTQGTQIEERLAELNEHIEKVIQMYLRNEFADIAEYNEQAGCIAEKSRFLVIAGFPAGFSETAAKRLLSIASSGARCGVHLLVHRDLRLPAPDPAIDAELRRVCTRVTAITEAGGKTRWFAAWDGDSALRHGATPSFPVTWDCPPDDDDETALIHRIGRASVDSTRVEVPFDHVTPEPEERWTLDTTDELRVAIGRTGAKKLQMLAIGKGTRQHMLVAGKTGSGKSTLFHVIVTNLALWASPEQVEFYLVDFKKGVEFKCYAAKRLPHARVVAIESDREFALSVLQRVDAELKRRGDLFRQRGAQDIGSFRRGGGGTMPRVLLLIDEFQEFFTEDDAVAQEASLLLDRIVRQGRAFGIHVILGSQTLGGAYTLARATLGQMVIRVALQCNEADAHLIMDDDNPAPRLLTRPGEGIYNDQAGTLAANSPFQTVWLDEDDRDQALDEVAALAKDRGVTASPVVFEGNAPADVRDNRDLAAALRSVPSTRPALARAWLGSPNSIKGPTEAVFQRQSGNHLLVVGQSPERTRTVLGLALLSLAAQHRAQDAKFVVLDPLPPDTPGGDLFQRLAAIIPHEVKLATPGEVAEVAAELAADLAARATDHGRSAPSRFVLVHDLQRFKALRQEDDFRFSLDDDSAATQSPSAVFAELLGEGSVAGIHVLAAIDTWNNVSRWIPRKLLGEFEMRVLFQMSANDSANLIDSPAASMLGLHRALVHNEHLGTLETFRPYALPDEEWFRQAADCLKTRC